MPISPPTSDPSALTRLAARIRGRVLSMSHHAGTPHLGSSLSVVDILVAAYFSAARLDPQNPLDPARDRVILSKGHAAMALYATLALRGFFTEALLDHFNEEGSPLPEQPSLHCAPGVEASTGSLGHGLPLALGMALAQRISGPKYRCFVIMSDGECQEGTTWEAAMFAAAQKLDHVIAIVDYNKWQATGRSREIMALDPLAAKWEAFGWATREVDGHDMKALVQVMGEFADGKVPAGKPLAVIAHTVKGKGVKLMEDDNNWHYRIPTAEELLAAHKELGLA